MKIYFDYTKTLRSIVFMLSILLALSLTACSDDNEIQSPTFNQATEDQTHLYRFGIHPLHNPQRLHETFEPMMDYLNKHIDNVEFKIEASRNYAHYDEKLFAGEFHFSLPNPYQTVTSLNHGYRVFGKMGDDYNFRGIFLVRKDAGIKEVTELKGKAVSYPAPTALAATMMPQYFLHKNGLDVMNEIDNRYVGSQESSIMNVFHGHTVAGATWPPPWLALSKERPELSEQLEIKWETEPLPNNGLVVRNDIPEALVAKVSDLIFNLHTHEEGRAILERMELSKFEAANNEIYQPVINFLENFTREIREPRKER